MTTLPLDCDHLASHVGIFSDTGGGKSLTLKAYLREVQRLGEIAVIWDPDQEYARKFRNVERGDWILDPTVEECPYWDIRREYRDEGEAHALSMCFLPDNPNVKDPFWNNSARGLLTVLNSLHHPTTTELGLWMANDALIDERVVGTEYERILTNNAPGMRSSIISHLNLIAQPLAHDAGASSWPPDVQRARLVQDAKQLDLYHLNALLYGDPESASYLLHVEPDPAHDCDGSSAGSAARAFHLRGGLKLRDPGLPHGSDPAAQNGEPGGVRDPEFCRSESRVRGQGRDDLFAAVSQDILPPVEQRVGGKSERHCWGEDDPETAGDLPGAALWTGVVSPEFFDAAGGGARRPSADAAEPSGPDRVHHLSG